MRSIASDPQDRHRPPEALEPSQPTRNITPIEPYGAIFLQRRDSAESIEQGLTLDTDRAAHPQKHRGHNRVDSGELHLLRHVTRDSMLENMLRSFDEMPRGQGPYPKHEPLLSSFQNGKLAMPFLENAPAPSQTAPKTSPTSPVLSDYDLRPEEYFNLEDTLRAHRRSKDCASMVRLSTEHVRRESNVDESPPHASPSASPKLAVDTVDIDNPAEEIQNATTIRSSMEEGTISGEAGGRLGRFSCGFDPHINKFQTRHPPSSESTSILGRARPVPGDYHDFEAMLNLNIPKNYTNMTSVSSSPDRSFDPRESNLSSAPTSPGHLRAKAHKGGRGTALPSTRSENLLVGDRSNNATPTNPLRHPPKVFEGVERLGANTPVPSMERHASSDSAKERPGFFRRVFSSPRVPIVAAEEAPQLPPLDLARKNDSKGFSRIVKSNQQASQSLSTHHGAQPEPPTIPSDLTLVLNKKASFFWRRKKTGSSKVYLSSGINRETSTISPQASRSISSLRQVMDPFLLDVVSPLEQDICFNGDEHQSADVCENADLHSSKIDFVNALSRKGNLHWRGSSASLMNPDSSVLQLSHAPRPLIPIHRISHESHDMEDRSGRSTPSIVVDHNNDHTRHKINPAPSSTANRPSRQMENQAPSRSSENEESVARTSSAKAQSRMSPKKASLRNNLLSDTNDDGFVIANPVRRKISCRSGSSRSNRVWLNPTNSDDERLISSGRVPLAYGESADCATSENSYSDEPESLPVDVPGLDAQSDPPPMAVKTLSDPDTLTAETIEQVKRTFDRHDDSLNQAKAVSSLGREGLPGDVVRQAYMAMYDFSGLNILLALRDLCGRLVLKGETQQVDRVLSSFSQRWCECNPFHGFRTEDVVYTICYSLLLLNTDLHLANLDQKMTRAQFIRNVVPTIRRAAKEEFSANDATIRPKRYSVYGSVSSRNGRSPSPLSSPLGVEAGDRRPSVDVRNSNSRVPSRQRLRVSSDVTSFLSPTPDGARPTDACDALVNGPFDGGKKSWEVMIENVLKEFYFSIRHQPLPLHGAPEAFLHEQPSNDGLSVIGGIMRRTGSMISKTPSEVNRVRNTDFRSVGNRWNRSKTKLPYQASTLGSSRNSLEDASLWSPSPSSTWSKSNLSKAHSTISSDSLSSYATRGDYGYQQSIGFANTLNHAIIREESSNNVNDLDRIMPLLEDETLEMAAPWAKEGIVQHKQHLEMTDKKSKDRSWRECFAVVEKGWMRLFSFNSKASVRTQKKKIARGGVVGGGNWTENAEALGSFMLRQTVANIMPPPGYARTRPHVFALSLPTGAVHLFQVGTAEIAKEFVSTANYWSARSSKEPLVGGFSPHQPNANKAMSNWERKSSYLLREIVKFRTYIDSLNAARDEKDRLQRERARAAILVESSSEPDRHATLRAMPQRSGTPVDPWVL